MRCPGNFNNILTEIKNEQNKHKNYLSDISSELSRNVSTNVMYIVDKTANSQIVENIILSFLAAIIILSTFILYQVMKKTNRTYLKKITV